MDDLLFPEWENDNNKLKWEYHWRGMPEYNNTKQGKPEITATFKFRNKEDFEEFNQLLKDYIYKTNKVFDGMQRKEKKSAWYPLNTKGSSFNYIGVNNES